MDHSETDWFGGLFGWRTPAVESDVCMQSCGGALGAVVLGSNLNELKMRVAYYTVAHAGTKT